MSVPSAELSTERAILIGAFLATLAYGIHVTLFVWCFRLLLLSSKEKRFLLLVFITLLVIFSSIGHAANVKLMVALFVNERDLPPLQVEGNSASITVLGNAADFVNEWLQDGLLLYRFWIFWHGHWPVLIIPSLMYPASFAISILLIVEELKPGILIWSKISVNLGVPYWSISIALNILITLSIASRLMLMRYQLRNIPALQNPEYFSTSAMFVESASLYSTVALVFLVSYASNSVVQHYTLAPLAQVQCISPLLIILRVVQGTAWSKKTVDGITMPQVESEVRFAVTGAKVGTGSKVHKTADGDSDSCRNVVMDDSNAGV